MVLETLCHDRQEQLRGRRQSTRIRQRLEQALELEVAGGDSCLDKNALLWLWAAAYMRWPEAIKAWTKATATERGASACSSRWRAEDWARASASVAKVVSGKAMEWIHDSISTGRMAQVMGAQVFLQWVCQREKPERKTKARR